MLHHIALAAPKRLLLLGDAPARALLGKTLAQARGETRSIDIAGVAIPAIASFHPRFVLERPDYRKPAWADLQMFMAL
jgi:DNA polymerase